MSLEIMGSVAASNEQPSIGGCKSESQDEILLCKRWRDHPVCALVSQVSIHCDEIILVSYITENSSHVNWGSPALTGFSTTLPCARTRTSP